METNPETTVEHENTHTTSRGYTLAFLSIPQLLVKLQSQFKAPTAPTYEVKTVTGIVETHPHDETTLDTDEDKAAWAAYQARQATYARDVFSAQLRLCLARGIQILTYPDGEPDAWMVEQELIGFNIPQDPAKRKMHFLETEVAATGEDVLSIIAGVSRASGVNEEAISSLEDSFRGAMGRARGETTQGAADTRHGGRMEHVEPVRADASSNGQNAPHGVTVGFAP